MEKKEIEMGKGVPCSKCGVTGKLEPGLFCGTCDGTGYVTILESRTAVKSVAK